MDRDAALMSAGCKAMSLYHILNIVVVVSVPKIDVYQKQTPFGLVEIQAGVSVVHLRF